MTWARLGAALLSMFTGPAGLIATLGAEFVQDFTATRQNARQVKQAAAEFRAAQARSAASYRAEWELRALEGGGVWMRRVTLALFCWPLIWAYIDPAAVDAYFDTLAAMPGWYLGSLGSMLAAVWGVHELRNMRAGRLPP